MVRIFIENSIHAVFLFMTRISTRSVLFVVEERLKEVKRIFLYKLKSEGIYLIDIMI